MLTNLTVQNFAIIDNINLEFNSGLTVLTGETGAGKSLIIDAIGILLGNKFPSSIIRNNETKAVIEGVFDSINQQTKEILDELGIDYDDDLLIIHREVNIQGRSIIRVNGNLITLSNLEMIVENLADIHTQEDTHKLFDSKNYLYFIDNNKSLEVLKEYQEILRNYQNSLKEYHNLIDDFSKINEQLDYYNYQLNEIKQANLDEKEYNEILEELEYLNNYETIYKNLSEIKSSFETNNITNNLYDIINKTEKIIQYNPNYQKKKEALDNIYFDLEDIEREINNDLHHMEFDEERLNHLNERISQINNLMKKYKKDIKGLILYAEELTEKIEKIDSSEFYINEALKKVNNLYNDLTKKAIELTNIRKENANILTSNIKKSLSDLLLDKVQLEIIFKEYEFNNFEDSKVFKKQGCDEIDFLISFNLGEKKQSLSKVASGGEMSRVMLAIKTHILTSLNLSTMIFDEIDTGVSGIVANKVAEKLKEISKTTQVLSITHLPIVASFADQHLLIQKEFTSDRTRTIVRNLNKEERINELAIMISPNDQSNKSVELAKMMLENSQK